MSTVSVHAEVLKGNVLTINFTGATLVDGKPGREAYSFTQTGKNSFTGTRVEYDANGLEICRGEVTAPISLNTIEQFIKLAAEKSGEANPTMDMHVFGSSVLKSMSIHQEVPFNDGLATVQQLLLAARASRPIGNMQDALVFKARLEEEQKTNRDDFKLMDNAISLYNSAPNHELKRIAVQQLDEMMRHYAETYGPINEASGSELSALFTKHKGLSASLKAVYSNEATFNPERPANEWKGMIEDAERKAGLNTEASTQKQGHRRAGG